MDRYAVVGNPVAHSLSPRIHAAFAAATGQTLQYAALPAPVDGFVPAVEAFFAAGGAGLNVTVPFKEQAAAWVDQMDAAAAAAGAVNTIVRDGGAGADVYRGCNTDGPGWIRDVVENCGESLRGARVLMLGAGGAARGILRPLLEQGPAELVIANRTVRRGADLAQLAASAAGATAVSAVGLNAVQEPFDVVISATSAGLQGAAPEVDGVAVRGAFCYDLIYAPLDGPGAATPFCAWAQAHGARRCVDGLGMLVEQAALAFELWRGVVPATAPVLELLRRGGAT